MCLPFPRLVEKDSVIAYKVMNQFNGQYGPIFDSALDECYDKGKIIEANNMLWHLRKKHVAPIAFSALNIDYPASFHCCKRLRDALRLCQGCQMSCDSDILKQYDYENYVIVIVRLTGTIYESSIVGKNLIAGTHMEILEELPYIHIDMLEDVPNVYRLP